MLEDVSEGMKDRIQAFSTVDDFDKGFPLLLPALLKRRGCVCGGGDWPSEWPLRPRGDSPIGPGPKAFECGQRFYQIPCGGGLLIFMVEIGRGRRDFPPPLIALTHFLKLRPMVIAMMGMGQKGYKMCQFVAQDIVDHVRFWRDREAACSGRFQTALRRSTPIVWGLQRPQGRERTTDTPTSQISCPL